MFLLMGSLSNYMLNNFVILGGLLLLLLNRMFVVCKKLTYILHQGAIQYSKVFMIKVYVL